MKRQAKGEKRKVYLILDNAKTHHSKILTGWAEENKKRAALFYLLSYSPDLNPDEHINADVKYGVGPGRPRGQRRAEGSG
ncbi:MAG: transposase [Treponema sp.]|nr:transposase [Treponema sp.]